nr:translation initiation factor IF-2-like [Aegilops tauschii subsp. strangulata]
MSAPPPPGAQIRPAPGRTGPRRARAARTVLRRPATSAVASRARPDAASPARLAAAPPPQLLAGAVLAAAARSARELAGPARRPAAGSGVPRHGSARPIRLRPCSGECPSPASFSALPDPDLEFSG